MSESDEKIVSKRIKLIRQIYELDDGVEVANKMYLHYVLWNIKQALSNGFSVNPDGLTHYTIEVSIDADVPLFTYPNKTSEYDQAFIYTGLRITVQEVVE